MGQVRVVPATGTVFGGAGTVWENPTRGLPVLNARCRFQGGIIVIGVIKFLEGRLDCIGIESPPQPGSC